MTALTAALTAALAPVLALRGAGVPPPPPASGSGLTTCADTLLFSRSAGALRAVTDREREQLAAAARRGRELLLRLGEELELAPDAGPTASTFRRVLPLVDLHELSDEETRVLAAALGDALGAELPGFTWHAGADEGEREVVAHPELRAGRWTIHLEGWVRSRFTLDQLLAALTKEMQAVPAAREHP